MLQKQLTFFIAFSILFLSSCANYRKMRIRKCDSSLENNIEQRQFDARNETVKPETLHYVGESQGGVSIKLDGIISKEELPQDQKCDSIILNNGDKYNLIILRTDNRHIVYSKCESSDRAQYVILKRNVSSLIYSHGEIEKFWRGKLEKENRRNDSRLLSSLEKNSTELNAYESNLAKWYAWWAIICFFGGIITIPVTAGIPALAVLVLCPLAYKFGNRVTRRGEVEKGSRELREARFGKAIGLAFYIGWSLAILTALVLLL